MPRQPERWLLADEGPESYERYQVPSIFAPLARLFLDKVSLQPGDRVLDVACGTGIVARLAAPQVGGTGRVVGVDLNPGMLAVARRHTPTEAIVEWREGDALALPSDDSRFDVVLCQQGLQFFPDPIGALREMHRVLVPGGRLALCVWRSIEHSPCNRVTAAALSRYVGREAASRLHAPFSFGNPDRLRALITKAGFHDVEIQAAVMTRRMLPPEESIPGHLASTPLAHAVAALDETKRASLFEMISRALASYRDAEGLAIPQGTYIAMAYK
jgi:ubiquinone/menaquinone biosynthesis C-methylase UbiE